MTGPWCHILRQVCDLWPGTKGCGKKLSFLDNVNSSGRIGLLKLSTAYLMEVR